MWNHSKSLILTYYWILIALVVWIGLAGGMLFLPLTTSMKALFYIIFLPGLASLYGLWKLLKNIRSGGVFIAHNIAMLRLVSWACFFGASALLVAAHWWPLLVFASGGIGFLGLFCRVIKNLLAEAIAIKEENDMTI